MLSLERRARVMNSPIFKVKYTKSKRANSNALRSSRNRACGMREQEESVPKERAPSSVVKKEKKELKRGELTAEDERVAKDLIKKRLDITRNLAETEFYQEDTIRGVEKIMAKLISTATMILWGEKSLPDCIDDKERVIYGTEMWVCRNVSLEKLCDTVENMFSFTAACLWLGIDEEACRTRILGKKK